MELVPSPTAPTAPKVQKVKGIKALYGIPIPLFKILYKKESFDVKSLRRGAMKHLKVYRIPGTKKLLFFDSRDLIEDVSFNSAVPEYSDNPINEDGDVISILYILSDIIDQDPKEERKAWWSHLMKGYLGEEPAMYFEWVKFLRKIKGGKLYGSKEILEEVSKKK